MMIICRFTAEGFFLKQKKEVTHPHMYNDMKLAFKENYCLDTLANFATTKVN